MGRHAAPGEEEPDAPAVVEVEPPRPPVSRPKPQPRGRHSVADEADDTGEDDGPLIVVPKAKRENSSQADLRLLRSDPALRNRVIAAVVVPFVLYVVVLLAIGRLDAFAVWVWLPMVTAGVTGGLLLDGAHRRSQG